MRGLIEVSATLVEVVVGVPALDVESKPEMGPGKVEDSDEVSTLRLGNNVYANPRNI
ncbi:MAG: hypothetical protein KTR25_15000 [Myxococcales bacterium]|nr:hypothetical protein [Myxococcales bacterium]